MPLVTTTPVPRHSSRRRARGALAAVAGIAALALPAVAWAPPTPPDKPPPGAGIHRDGPETWPVCAVGLFNGETVGREDLGVAGGMSVSVLWQNQSYVTFLPVTLTTDGIETSTMLRPRQTIRLGGTNHISFSDGRRYPEFVWSVSADTPSDAVLLSYAVSAPRCHGSDE
jgi:hypothetical protein